MRAIFIPVFTILSLSVPVRGQSQMEPSWLDSPLNNWNQSANSIPSAPPTEGESAITTRCSNQIRSPETPEDQQIIEAGWTLYGPYQLFSGVALVSAMSDVDGMCRPLGYQEFVFVNGEFAGTLSPQPMDSRTDASLKNTYLYSASHIRAEFARYRERDPLCCPSQTSVVTYRIEKENGLPVVVPVEVVTNENFSSFNLFAVCRVP